MHAKKEVCRDKQIELSEMIYPPRNGLAKKQLKAHCGRAYVCAHCLCIHQVCIRYTNSAYVYRYTYKV